MILLCVSSSYAEDYEKSKNTKPIANDDEPVKGGEDEPPEGYYAFVESPNAEPPKVRPPPYIDSDKECYGRSGTCKKRRISKRYVRLNIFVTFKNIEISIISLMRHKKKCVQIILFIFLG